MECVEASRDDLKNEILRKLVSFSLYRADDTKVDAFLQRVDTHKTRILLALSDEGLLGQVTVTHNTDQNGQGKGMTIDSISVLPNYRRKGVGRFLLRGLLSRFPDSIAVAETDNDAVGFYHQCGFRIRSLGEAYSGTVRYHCLYDHTTWDPMPYHNAIDHLQKCGIQAWVAGGWALDLYQGKQTREHADTDVVICRSNQGLLSKAFPGWEIYRTHAPGLALWTGDSYLGTTPNTWLRRDQDSPWSLEVMFLDTHGDEWLYRRNTAVRGRMQDFGLVTADGIPYIRPEIQLLYKGGASHLREKDTRDLLSVLPILPEKSRRWLAHSLRVQFPQGHEWLRYLEGLSAG